MRPFTLMAVLALNLIMSTRVEASPRISLIIEGGGLPPYCPALERLVETARDKGRLRIGYIPTASSHPEASTTQFIERMKPYGVKPEEIQPIRITVENASIQAESPDVVKQIGACTAIFFGGGDQTRITGALRRSDGTSTAALEAIYAVWKSGAVIAGSSAGAAVQSETMITVSGVPDDLIDEGFSALDFGLTRRSDQPSRRGLLLSGGLGFLRSGIIDQHFTQYRGRLGRLARAATEGKVRYGFGIDEDTALIVFDDGSLEILGAGHVTIVDSATATLVDGPWGCAISGIKLSCLGHRDRFDPSTGKALIDSNKKRIEPGKEGYNGNFLIPDIAGRGALQLALFGGLGNNTSRRQIGIALKYNRHYGHGYQFTFSKTDQTECFEGMENGVDVEAVTHVDLGIKPVSMSLRSPESGVPRDLSEGPSRKGIEAILFRGIMVAETEGHFRPKDPITRADFANAITQAILLEPSRKTRLKFIDVPSDSRDYEDISLVVESGLMTAEKDEFRPADSIPREEAALMLVRLAERYRSKRLATDPVQFEDSNAISIKYLDSVNAAVRAKLIQAESGKFRPQAAMTREEAASSLFQLIEFSWAH